MCTRPRILGRGVFLNNGMGAGGEGMLSVGKDVSGMTRCVLTAKGLIHKLFLLLSLY